MSSSRESILGKLRQHLPQSQPLPALDDLWTTYDSPIDQFRALLEQVGGQCIVADSVDAINAHLAQFEPYTAGKSKLSFVDGVGESTLDIGSIADPHDLEHIDYAILPGELAVAENAAVWVDDEGIPHRVVYFIAQHLALVVPKANVVHTLHEAYDQIDVTARPFGAFISGPSKTADIEQSLVIGAHGARSLTVFLLDSTT